MSDLLKSFKGALAMGGAGIIAQMQGKEQLAIQLFNQGYKGQKAIEDLKATTFNNDMKLMKMRNEIRASRERASVDKAREQRMREEFEIRKHQLENGIPVQRVNFQQMRDTYNEDTGNPVSFDPTKKKDAIVDMVTGEPVKKVYTGVQNRFETKDARAVEKDLAKEKVRQQPVEEVLSSLELAEEYLDQGQKKVEEKDSFFGIKMGFTGGLRSGYQEIANKSSLVPKDDIDRLYENFKGQVTNVIANRIKAASGAQVSDRERVFLEGMMPRPSLDYQTNKTRIANMRQMMQFVNDRNKAISQRLGRPIKDITKHIGPGQSVIDFVEKNDLYTGDESDEGHKYTPEETVLFKKAMGLKEKMNALEELIRNMGD